MGAPERGNGDREDSKAARETDPPPPDERPPAPGLSVLLVSGYADAAVLGMALTDGTMDYLPKPYSREALALAVRSALD